MPLDPTHPAPLVQRPWISLDGEWECTIDAAGDHQLPSDPDFADRITVPFAPETPASGIGTRERVGTIWYRRNLDVTPTGDGERVLVHFGAVDRITDVWVDGHHVAHHVGGYTAFTVDITVHARPGAELVVRAVDDEADLEVPRGKQEWRDEPHAIWYPRTTGIWRTVWVERVPATRIAGIDWNSDPSAMTVTAHVHIDGLTSSDDVTHLRLRLRVGDRVLVDDHCVLTDRTLTRTMEIGDGGFDDRMNLVWWPIRPTLIEAELSLEVAGRTIDEVTSYTALRSVEVSGNSFRLNGRPYPLRLVLDQGYWPDTGATPPDVEALEHDLRMTKALGFNGARKHQKTEDPRYFAAADRMGVLCWVEMPSAYRPGPRTTAAVLDEWQDIVVAHRNHPSVVAWVPINESWGVPDCEGDPRQRALIEALCASTHALDGTRPVSANDGWETVGGEIVGIHDYTQDPTVLAERYGDAAAIDRLLTGRRHDGTRADLAGQPLGDRAAMLTEFGGIALDADTDQTSFGLEGGSWGYDGAATADDLLERYRDQWDAVRASTALVGACWTQLTDTYQEVNGLLRADRTPKGDLAAFRAATTGRSV